MSFLPMTVEEWFITTQVFLFAIGAGMLTAGLRIVIRARKARRNASARG